MTKDKTHVLMEAKGLHGQLELLHDKVRIGRKGFLAEPKGRDKEIPLGRISAVRYEDAGLRNHGYVRFLVEEREDEEGQLRASDDDEDTVLFHIWEKRRFGAIKRAIEQRIEESRESG